jgi:hypothetical protein
VELALDQEESEANRLWVQAWGVLVHISNRTVHEVRSLREEDCRLLASFYISKALSSCPGPVQSRLASEAEANSARAIVSLDAAKAASTLTYSVLGRLVDRKHWLSIWVPFVTRTTSQTIEILKSCDPSESSFNQAKIDSALSFGLVLAFSALAVHQAKRLDLPPADLVQDFENIIQDYAVLLDPDLPLEQARDQALAIIQIVADQAVIECPEEDLPQKPKRLLPEQ